MLNMRTFFRQIQYRNLHEALLWTCVAIGIFACLFWAKDTRTTTEKERVFFSSALIDAHVSETVSVGERTITISEGHIVEDSILSEQETLLALRLGYEKAVARRNPLVALPGVDTQGMFQAIRDVRVTRDLLSQQQTQARDRMLIRTSLYPDAFLSAAAQLEESRRAFLESGRAADARSYESQLQRTIRAYRADIARFRDAFSTAVTTSAGTYATPRYLVDRESILNALHTLDTGMAHTEAIAAMRMSCFSGHITDCDTRDITFPTTTATAAQSVSPEAHSLAMTVRATLIRAGYKLDPDETLLQLGANACIVSQKYTAPLFTFETVSTKYEPEYLSPRLVGDIPLVSSKRFETTPFFSYFAAQGITYVPVNPLSYYVCPVSAQDMGRLGALRAIREYAQTARISMYASGDTLEALKKMEGTTPVITDEDAVAYLSAARQLIESGDLSVEDTNTITSLALALRDNSLGVYQTLQNIVFFEQVDIDLNAHGIPLDFSPAYLFFARSAFPDLFLADNVSATGVHDNLFKPNTVPEESMPYIYYSSLPNTAAVQDEVTRNLQLFYSLHAKH